MREEERKRMTQLEFKKRAQGITRLREINAKREKTN